MSAACSQGGGWGLWQSIAEIYGLSQHVQGRMPWGRQERQTSAVHSGILVFFPEAAAAPPEEPASFTPSAKTHAWEWLERVSMVLWFNPSQAGAEPTWDVRTLEDSAKPVLYLLLVLNFKVKKIPCLIGWSAFLTSALASHENRPSTFPLPGGLNRLSFSFCKSIFG